MPTTTDAKGQRSDRFEGKESPFSLPPRGTEKQDVCMIRAEQPEKMAVKI